ncbi:TKL protein kinase [Saprolegnia diclina VS20]|uniref:TKL protein kinase n=1 Tax=Saprolegnia diclina (strain VS20) TaxID=1156394 RepID=T0R416_SAPDV|nr:TKL protein kinase [Saprolegnia diclina VS20]EQC26788.1 TKL protein kinase [Saprolegnia diclina VS20]|eukprot:XP_008619770.1 TKL protein kinase [Saprolegnia diclina VS20]
MDLTRAVARGDTARVTELLQSGVDPDSRDKYGTPVLVTAAKKGYVGVAQLLLNASATVDLTALKGETALIVSPFGGSVELVRLLLEHSADVNYSCPIGTPLQVAASAGKEDIIDELLAAGANVNFEGDTQIAPILIAASSGHVATALRLVSAGANLASVDKNGEGAVFRAVHKGHADMVRLLVDNGADPNATSPAGYPPLYVACVTGRTDSVGALLQGGANVNPTDTTPCPCLVAAATFGHSEIVALLLEARADVNVIESKAGATAMYGAACRGHVDVVRQLAYARAKLDVLAFDGTTPLDAAFEGGHKDVLAVLHDVRTKKMELLHAARLGDVQIIQTLLSEGLSVNETDEHANSLLHLALLGRHEPLLAELLHHEECELYGVNKFGESPTTIAAKLGIPSLIHRLHAVQASISTEVDPCSTVHLQEIGRGGFGIVFKGTLHGHGVAVKVLRNSKFGAASLRDEIQILKNNPSPYLVRLIATADAASDAPQLFFEYMDGGSLTSYLEKLAKDEVGLVTYTPIEILWVVANALNDLHKKNVVHRDIKPDNILLSSKHYIKVGDVGIAKEESTYMTTGAGTSKWRAPEVLTSGSGYGKAADIYSFGILLQTLYPNPTDPSTEWAQALAADCTAVDPTRRPTAAEIVELMLPKLQSQLHLVASMHAFEQDKAAGLQVPEYVSLPAGIERRTMPAAPSTTTLVTVSPAFPLGIGQFSSFSRDEELIEAIEDSKVEIIRTLIESGVHPDGTGVGDMTPLMHAVHFNDIAVIDVLLAYHADVNKACCSHSTAMHQAARQSSSKTIERLLRVENANVNVRDGAQDTPLHLASAEGCLTNVLALVNAGADLEATDVNMNRPLHFAASYGRKDVAALLVSCSARTSERNAGGETPLHIALMCSHDNVATLLVEAGADVHVLASGRSPLHCACEYGVAKVIPALLARGADVNAKHDLASLLVSAIEGDRMDVAAALLASPHIDLHECQDDGQTILHAALLNGNHEIVRRLIQAGVDVDQRETELGVNALDLVLRMNDREMDHIVTPASNHLQALMRALRRQNVPRFAALLQKPNSCNFSDEAGNSLVHSAVLAGNEAILDLLLAQPRAQCDTRNHEQKTPLALAIEGGSRSMAKKLFDRTHKSVVEISEAEYEVTTKELGAGGFGVVLLGWYLGQKVAIKKLKNAGLRMPFEAEVNALLTCPSPYLMRLVAIADCDSENPALLFDYMDSGSLRTYLDKKRFNGRTRVTVTNLQVAWVVANALKDLHAKKLVHRDVKSDNVLLGAGGEIKLADLGLARLEATDMTEAPGTRYWMAPEILQAGGTTYGRPADIYAFGVLLTELDTCELPYFDQDVQDPIMFVDGVIRGTRRPTLTKNGQLWLRQLAETCLLGDPKSRPTANQIVEVLQKEMAAPATATKSPETDTFLRAVANDEIDAVRELFGYSMPYALPPIVGSILLVVATTSGAVKTLRYLLKSWPNVNELHNGTTLLHGAVSANSKKTLEMLIDAGADVDTPNHEGKTALMIALNTARTCITPLLATGADVCNLDGTTLLEKARNAGVSDYYVSALTIAESRKENVDKPVIMCAECGNWHAVDAVCSCGHDASSTDRMVAVVRRLMRLHHRGFSVMWMRTCNNCHQSTMTIVEMICPKCGTESRKSMTELKMLNIRLKMAMKPTATRLAPNNVPEIPHGILRWLARTNELAAQPLRTLESKDRIADDEQEQAGTGALGGARCVGRFVCLQHLLDGEVCPFMTPRDQSHCTSHGSTSPVDRAAAMGPTRMESEPEILADELPKPGVPFKLHEAIVTHRRVRTVEHFDAIVSCSSPHLLKIVACVAPTSIVVSHHDSLYELIQVPDECKLELDEKVNQIQVAYAVAKALAEVHSHGLVHGYLSSHNVFFDSSESTKVGVPGTSAIDDALLAWTAPEVLAGHSPPSFASDIYAFGILLTELDTLKLPFDDYDFEDDVEITTAVVDGGLRPTLRDDCEQWYRNLVGLCLDVDPHHRPTAADLVELLLRGIWDYVRSCAKSK